MLPCPYPPGRPSQLVLQLRMEEIWHQLVYLECHGDLLTGLIMGIIRVTIWIIGVINLLTKSL